MLSGWMFWQTLFSLVSCGSFGAPGCIPPSSPREGRVSLGRGGVIASFSCSPGHELIGTQVVVCVRGQWSNSSPECRPIPGKMSSFLFLLTPSSSTLSHSFNLILILYELYTFYFCEFPKNPNNIIYLTRFY